MTAMSVRLEFGSLAVEGRVSPETSGRVPPSVSVVIPTYNRAASLERCLRALPEDVEVVIVDDGSTDSTGSVPARVRHPRLRYLRKENGGPASARNLGIRNSSGSLVAFTDDDCLPSPGWARSLATRLHQEPSDVAGVGGRVLPLRRGLIGRYSTFHRILEPPSSCSYLVTANCIYRREALERVGGFDESIRRPGGEDPDLAFRVRAHGYRLVFEPTAVVRHEYRENPFDFVRTFYRYGRGCANVVV
jgi:glycosyltransferase involved in cell wall biosynthesis